MTTVIPNATASESLDMEIHRWLLAAGLPVTVAGKPLGNPFVVVRMAGRTEPSRGFRRRVLVWVCGRALTTNDPDEGLEALLNATLISLDSGGWLIVATNYVTEYDPTSGGGRGPADPSGRRFPAVAIEVEEV